MSTRKTIMNFAKEHPNLGFGTKDLIDITQVKAQTLHTTLHALMKKGFLERVSYGLYRLANSDSSRSKFDPHEAAGMTYEEIGKAIVKHINSLDHQLVESLNDLREAQRKLNDLQGRYNELKINGDSQKRTSFESLGIPMGGHS